MTIRELGNPLGNQLVLPKSARDAGADVVAATQTPHDNYVISANRTTGVIFRRIGVLGVGDGNDLIYSISSPSRLSTCYGATYTYFATSTGGAYILKRVGATLSLVQTLYTSVGPITAAMHYSSDYLIHNLGSTSPDIVIRKRNGDTFEIIGVLTMSGGIIHLKFSLNGAFLIVNVSGELSPRVFSFSDGVLTEVITGITNNTVELGNQSCVSNDGNVIVFKVNTSPFSKVYVRSNGVFTYIPYPTAPTLSADRLVMSSNGKQIIHMNLSSTNGYRYRINADLTITYETTATNAFFGDLQTSVSNPNILDIVYLNQQEGYLGAVQTYNTVTNALTAPVTMSTPSVSSTGFNDDLITSPYYQGV